MLTDKCVHCYHQLTFACQVILAGPPGVGKTQLAYTYANLALRNNAYAFAWVIGARSAIEIELGYESLAAFLQV
jgi:DNA polymerase III delta prime subunit